METEVTETVAPVETAVATATETPNAGSAPADGAAKASAEAPPLTTKENVEKTAEAAIAKRAEAAKTGAGDKTSGQVPATDTYKPNTKFKVLDKEHDIDPKFHGLMKDAESEKAIRELHEKAFGLDVVKPKLQEVRTERDAAVHEAGLYKSTIAEAADIFRRAVAPGGDILKLENLWKKLEIPDQVVMQYALAKARLAQAPPEQRQQVEARLQAENQAEIFAKNQSLAEQQRLSSEREMKVALTDIALARPDIQPIAEAFNTRMGKSDAFRNAVFQMGHMQWVASQGKVNLTPEQAAQEVIKQYGLSAPAAAAAPAATGVVAPAAPAAGVKTVVVPSTPTIPNIGSKGNSPLTKTAPRSIEDLKALQKKAAAGETI